MADGDHESRFLPGLLAGHLIAGLDEAGRGPLAGPVVAAAVVLDPARPITGLDDSKRLDERRRDALFQEITAKALGVGVASKEAHEIDEQNILRASLHAMRDAFLACEAAAGRTIAGALVDGNQLAPLPQRVNQRAIVGGDALCESIMAASIVAKVTRDRRMVEEAGRYPDYGFERHKGYPTAQHRAALATFGPCPLHRRSFATVRRQLELLHDAVTK
ncbi:MAG: ribonuclease HII [Myxococcota bacterium]